MDMCTLLKNLERPMSKIDAVLDTDAYNEIDDQYALAYMISNSQRINIKAIYAAPFTNEKSSSPKEGMEKSYDEIIKIISLTGHDSLIKSVFKGSEYYLLAQDTENNEIDEKNAVTSRAASHLAELAMSYSPANPLYVVAIGAITNVASAILIKPEIINNIVIVWLGGHAHHWHDTKEFNMFQDIAAARVVFGCGAPVVQLPCNGVVSAFAFGEPELKKWLDGKNKVCDYLVQNTIDEANSYASGKPWTRVIWDVTAVAWLLEGDFFCERIERSPIPEYDGYYSFRFNRHFMKYVYHVNRDALAENLFNKLAEL